MQNESKFADTIIKFKKSHPDYRPSIIDIEECIRFISLQFPLLIWDICGDFADFQRAIRARDKEISELKSKNYDKKQKSNLYFPKK